MQLSVPRKLMRRDITDWCRKHCPHRKRLVEEWCSIPRCPLYKYRATREPQLDLFRVGTFADFVHQIISLADRLSTPFWWSRVRDEAEKLSIVPINDHWWGNVTRSRDWRKRYRLTGASRPSTVPRNKGSAEFQWDLRLDAQGKQTAGSSAA